MSAIMFDGSGFSSEGVLVEESLFETLFRLEEAHYGLRGYQNPQIRKALDWLMPNGQIKIDITQMGKQKIDITAYDRRLTGGYRNPSGEYIRKKYVKLPTGEQKGNLNIQYINQLLTWGKELPTVEEKAKNYFLNVYPAPYKKPYLAQSGRFCCTSCNILYQKTLKLTDPDFYAKQEKAFMRNLSIMKPSTGRWRGYPFYYTILTLKDIDSAATRNELRNVAKYVSESLLEKYSENDRALRFRKLAIQTVLEYR